VCTQSGSPHNDMHLLVLHLSPQDLFASLVPKPPRPAFMYTVDLNSFSFFLGIE